jgi:hypothetical protein
LLWVDTCYQPPGPLPRPAGGYPPRTLIWLRPADEAELLTSLDAAGEVTLDESPTN